ncbi:MAG: CRISPR-associated endoribonuclease Cas6 [Brevinematia bacterium]
MPIIYRHIILSLIKESLKLSDVNYKKSLYEDKILTKKVKPFTFSLILPKGSKAKKEHFYLNDNLKVEDYVFYPPEYSDGRNQINVKPLQLLVSSIDYEFITHLYNGLIEMKKFKFYQDIEIEIGRIIPILDKPITSNKVVFKTYSPILIENKDGKPVLRDNTFPYEEFNRELNIIESKILKDIRGNALKEEIKFEPIPGKWKKQVVKHTLGKIISNLGKPYATFTCFEGYFTLSGDIDDLKTLYNIGLGLRTGQGFGMVEVV